MKSVAAVTLLLSCSLAATVPVASAEVLYDKEGIQLQGSARIVSRNAASCNVLEEKYSAEEYEELKGNQGQPLHVWRLDFSAHNNTGKALDFLTASFFIEAPEPPCTNWSGEGPGGGPSGDFTDDEGIPGHPLPGDQLRVLSRAGGMEVGEVERETDFLVVFHTHKPVFAQWSVNFTVARTRSRAPAAGQPAGQAPPQAAIRPRIQLPPDILADKYLRQAEQLVEEKRLRGGQEGHGAARGPAAGARPGTRPRRPLPLRSSLVGGGGIGESHRGGRALPADTGARGRRTTTRPST